MEFVKVQIPHRGLIPIIHSRGPLAEVLLDKETVKKLQNDFRMEILDPNTGKPIVLDEEPMEKAIPAVEEEVAEAVATATETAAVDVMEKVPTATEVTVSAEASVVMDDEPKADTEEKDAPVAEAHEEPETTEEPASSNYRIFDHTKIANYSSLTKGKKRELRSYFAEHINDVSAQLTIEKLYEDMNELATKPAAQN